VRWLGGTSVLLTTNPAAGTETLVAQYDPTGSR
jgi:hypothetical protein